jgi:hypothetical protein
MTRVSPATPWDDLAWRESDNAWTAGCRWLQSWWREQNGFQPGPLSRSNARPVASMLDLDAPADANFLDERIATAVESRLAEGDHSGIIEQDRLRRNLLSSQPACFNLFGRFVEHPNDLYGWVASLDPEVTEVDRIRFEWAPDRSAHFDGGSAFDAFVEYWAGGSRRFLGIECKYAEDLSSSSINVREVYRAFTEACGLWLPGAKDRLEEKKLRQFWLNTLLVQSLATRPPNVYDRGMCVVVACEADHSAVHATDSVRGELIDPDSWLRWSPYEQVLAHVKGHDDWKRAFTARYLDMTPVQHRLARVDPRRRQSHEG